MPGNDDLLDPSEIEALLKSAGALGGAAPPPPTDSATPTPSPPLAAAPSPPPGAPAPAPTDILNSEEIEALFRGGVGASSGPVDLLNRAQEGVAAALGSPAPARTPVPDRRAAKPPPDPRLSQAKAYTFAPLDAAAPNADPKSLAALEEVELDLRIELGRAELLIEEVLKLREGSVVPLDKLAGDPVDILVNGRLVARGEVLVLNDNFCVRVAEILAPSIS